MMEHVERPAEVRKNACLDELAEEVKSELAAMEECLLSGLEKACRVGRVFVKAYAACKECGVPWTHWLRDHFPNVNRMKAWRYMKVYRDREQMQTESVRAALKQLTEHPGEPDEESVKIFDEVTEVPDEDPLRNGTPERLHKKKAVAFSVKKAARIGSRLQADLDVIRHWFDDAPTRLQKVLARMEKCARVLCSASEVPG